MGIYNHKPWLKHYDDDMPASIEREFENCLSMFEAAVARNPNGDAIRYFGTHISYRELDKLTDAFACALMFKGVRRGERVALYLQNNPQFVIGLIGTWKAGAIAVSVNPMNRARELELLLNDSGASVLVCLETLYDDVAASVLPNTSVRTVITTSELEYVRKVEPRLFSNVKRLEAPGASDMATLLDEFANEQPPRLEISSSDIAFLTYTSGTTGPPKGAMNTHGNVVFDAQVFCHWCKLDSQDTVLAIAPLFHITGLVAHINVAILLGVPLLLMHRFDPNVVVETIHREKATFTIGAITAFIALMNVQDAEASHLSTFRKLLSGGAPVPAATAEAFHAKFGQVIHNAYGMTETTSAAIAVPFGSKSAVDETTGALTVGVPVFNTVVRIVDEEGQDVEIGGIGEIVISGPQVVPAYWNNEVETDKAMLAGGIRTGDIGFMDEDGWFYVVDRKKDMIIAGGYKVWPREVEDVLYEHEAVFEAAVIGIPDTYRGETVKAFVSIKPNTVATPDELIQFCKSHLAAYKYPREIEILAELPKTASGKILRRALRQTGSA